MTTPQAIVFDLGKVLVDFDYGIAAGRIAARGTVGALETRKILNHPSLLFPFETGEISRREFFERTRLQTGYAGTMEEFGRLFADIFTPIPDMIALHAACRAQGLPTYIFSNTNDLAIDHIRANFPFFTQFTGYVYSYEHGSMKPDARLYEVVESVTGLSGDALLYLDDREENIDTGIARGWRVIHHQAIPDTLTRCAEQGITLPPSLAPKP